jgi:hypothetical protein
MHKIGAGLVTAPQFGAGLTAPEIATALDVSRRTAFRYLRESSNLLHNK